MPAPLVNPPSSGSSVTNMREEEIAIGNSTGVADTVHLIGIYLMGVYLTGLHLMGVCLTGVHLMGVHPTGAHLMGVHLIGVYLMGIQPMVSTS